MESNRDEAERCIEIAAQSLRDSKMEKAEKFLKKAEQLFPSQKAKGKIVEKTYILPTSIFYLTQKLRIFKWFFV